MGRLHLHKGVTLAVRELFGCEERTVLVGVEGVDHGQRRVGVAHGYETAVGSVDLKTCARIRDGLARSAVGLNYVEIGLEVCVVNEVAIYFAVLADKHLKGIEQLTAFPALDLSYHVYAVRQVDGFGIAELITGEDISLGGFGGFIAACALEVHLKHGTDFGCFDLGGAVISMLDDGDLAFDDILVHVGIHGVQLNRILPCVGVDIIDGFVEQVSFGGADLTDRPFHVLVARIVVSKEISVLVCRIGVDERTILEYTVYCTFEGSIALGLSIDAAEVIDHCIGVEGECHRHQLHWDKPAIAVIEACQVRVDLEHVGSPFLEDIVELDLGHLVPLNDCALAFGDHVTDGGVDFLHGVILTDEDIFEYCHTVLVGVGVNADLLAGERGSVEVESHAFHEVILGGLDDLEVAALQLVVHLGCGYFCPFDLHVLTVGYDILEGGIHFLQHVSAADEDVLEIRLAGAVHRSGHVDLNAAVGGAGETELDAFGQTVLSSLGDGKITALEDVVKGHRCGLIIFHRNGLGCLRLVVVFVLLGYRIGAGQETFDLDLSVCIGGHVLGDAVAGYHERNSRYNAILRGFNDLEVAALEGVVKQYGCGLSRYDSYGFCRLRFVAILDHLGHGVSAGAKVIHLNNTVIFRGYGLIDTVSRNGELDAVYHTVLTVLDDLHRSGSSSDLEIGRHGVVIGWHTGHHILVVILFAGYRPNEEARCVGCGRHSTIEFDGNRIGQRLCGADGQRIAVNGYRCTAVA